MDIEDSWRNKVINNDLLNEIISKSYEIMNKNSDVKFSSPNNELKTFQKLYRWKR
jgi:hypothetical protein